MKSTDASTREDVFDQNSVNVSATETINVWVIDDHKRFTAWRMARGLGLSWFYGSGRRSHLWQVFTVKMYFWKLWTACLCFVRVRKHPWVWPENCRHFWHPEVHLILKKRQRQTLFHVKPVSRTLYHSCSKLSLFFFLNNFSLLTRLKLFLPRDTPQKWEMYVPDGAVVTKGSIRENQGACRCSQWPHVCIEFKHSPPLLLFSSLITRQPD